VKRTIFAFPLAVFGVLAACGSEDDSTFLPGGGDPDAAASSSSSGTPGPGPGIGNEGGPGSSCPSAVLCGATGTCCAVGQECVEGACATACETGIRCGATCCPTGNVCLSQACVVPGAACQDSFDCAENEFCEPTLNQCLPQPEGGSSCEYKPPVLPLAPALEWSWTGSPIQPGSNQVINTPLVMDLDGDTFPEVVVVSSESFDAGGIAYLRVLDGRTGTEKWGPDVAAYTAAGQVAPRSTPALGDIDGNGSIEIVAARKGGGVIAFRADGSILWNSTRANGVTAYNGTFDSTTVALADLDNDGRSEVVLGGVILDSTGKLTSDAAIGREKWGANDASYGAVSIVADVDGSPATTTQFVVTGNRAIARDGSFLWNVSNTVTDGYPAIADLDRDGVPELVVIAQSKVRVQNALTGAVLAELALPGAGRGGPPTLADFDNDGVLEIASANGTRYNVFEYDPAANPKLSVKWQTTTKDGSSNVTGSSVFDFEGDGSSEVVYNDECYARVYKGIDGSELFRIANSSATIHEMPVLVDVDGDNNTEFVVVANDLNHGSPAMCPDYAAAGDAARHGVFVYGDSNDKWVRTRKLWNQHAYHITNVASDGTIPAVEPRSFTTEQNNDYRVSSQGKGVYNAPDLKVDLEVSTLRCPANLELRARVSNQGALGVPAGVKVRFYAGTSNAGTLIGEKLTTTALLPGQSEIVTQLVPGSEAAYFVEVDGAAVAGSASVDECNEDNNGAQAGGVSCPSVN